MPVNRGKALGDLGGIAKVSQHKLVDLGLVAPGLARRDNEILDVGVKFALNLPPAFSLRNLRGVHYAVDQIIR